MSEYEDHEVQSVQHCTQMSIQIQISRAGTTNGREQRRQQTKRRFSQCHNHFTFPKDEKLKRSSTCHLCSVARIASKGFVFHPNARLFIRYVRKIFFYSVTWWRRIAPVNLSNGLTNLVSSASRCRSRSKATPSP